MSDKKVIVTGVAGLIFGLCVFLLWAGLVASGIYGLYLAFSASIVLGIVFLLVFPLFPISGLLMLFFDFNLPMKILELISK